MDGLLGWMQYAHWSKEDNSMTSLSEEDYLKLPSVHPSSNRHTHTHTHTHTAAFSVPVCSLWESFQCLMFRLVRWQVGIILHYSTLSSMLWLLFTARNICKEVSKAPPIPQDRDPPKQPRPKATIFRYTAWRLWMYQSVLLTVFIN